MKSCDLCKMWCEGKDIIIKNKLIEEDLIIKQERDRILYFSIVGNKPKNPFVALVGLCPGSTQLITLIENYNLNKDFEKAAELSSFRKITKNIAKMLRKIGIDQYLKIEIKDEFDFNNSPLFLTTSLVKCAALKEGKGRSNEFQPLDYNFSASCLKNRFLADILNKDYKNLKKIIIFGKQGAKAVSERIVEDKSIKEVLELNGKEVMFLPHPSGSNNGGVAKFLSK